MKHFSSNPIKLPHGAAMKLTVKIFRYNKVTEKTVEGDSIIEILDDIISEIGGNKNKFKIFCEKSEDNIYQYLVFRGNKKACVLRITSD